MPEALTDQTVKAVYDKTTTDKINALLPEEDKSYKKGTYYGRDTDKKNIVHVDINKDGVISAVSGVKGDDKHKEECKKLADGSLTADKLDDGSFKDAEGNALVLRYRVYRKARKGQNERWQVQRKGYAGGQEVHRQQEPDLHDCTEKNLDFQGERCEQGLHGEVEQAHHPDDGLSGSVRNQQELPQGKAGDGQEQQDHVGNR